MKIKYTKQAIKTLRAYDEQTRKHIREKIKGLIVAVSTSDIKPMQNSKTEKRLRVGKYRIIFERLFIDHEEVLIIKKIDTRGNVYK